MLIVSFLAAASGTGDVKARGAAAAMASRMDLREDMMSRVAEV